MDTTTEFYETQTTGDTPVRNPEFDLVPNEADQDNQVRDGEAPGRAAKSDSTQDREQFAMAGALLDAPKTVADQYSPEGMVTGGTG